MNDIELLIEHLEGQGLSAVWTENNSLLHVFMPGKKKPGRHRLAIVDFDREEMRLCVTRVPARENLMARDPDEAIRWVKTPIDLEPHSEERKVKGAGRPGIVISYVAPWSDLRDPIHEEHLTDAMADAIVAEIDAGSQDERRDCPWSLDSLVYDRHFDLDSQG